MNCEYVKENFDEYTANELDSESAEKIKKHLESCDECRGFFSELKKLKNNYPDYEKKIPYPVNLEEKLKNSLKDLEKLKV